MKPDYSELDQAIIDCIDNGAKYLDDIYPQVETLAAKLSGWHPRYFVKQRLKYFKDNGQASFSKDTGWSAL